MKNTGIHNTSDMQLQPRPPVVAVMGHIDHGKSTLLDYIRKANVVKGEAGGITQHLGAYETTFKSKDGVEHPITFLDTPGHEAFRGMRERGAALADIAVLVVSAEEGVKPQTLEAFEFIKKEKIPYLVAATKIDRPEANLERVRQGLAEKEIYVEGYGGDIPCVGVSGTTGAGVDELLETILLLAELHEVGKKDGTEMKGFIAEAKVERTKGIAAVLIIKQGVLRKGEFVVAEEAFAPTRRIDNFLGEPMEEARGGNVVHLMGWSEIPRTGAVCVAVGTKREAEALVEQEKERKAAGKKAPAATYTTRLQEKVLFPLVIKADMMGGLEAVEAEVLKRGSDVVEIKIIQSGIGPINENDLKVAAGATKPAVVGFHIGIDASAKPLSERAAFPVKTFDIIYHLLEWLEGEVKARTPKVRVEEKKGTAKILKIFSQEKDKQIIGGKVLDGELSSGDEFNIFRRGTNLGKGRIRELQKFKEKVREVSSGAEFGGYVSSDHEIMAGDQLEVFTVVEK
ncbi:MAG: GTP-binding protein [bacterium]|nr:GTP-binding protein [bacterium]